MTSSRSPISFIATTEPGKAKTFYSDIIGLVLLEQSPYALAFGDGANMLRVQIVAGFTPASHTVHGWQVTDLDRDITDLAAKGVDFLKFDQLPQDASGIWTSPDGHKIAWFKDPSENILSLTQYAEA